MFVILLSDKKNQPDSSSAWTEMQQSTKGQILLDTSKVSEDLIT